jgi:hypothetical protein
MRAAEHAAGMDRLSIYEGFGERVARIKRRFVAFLIEAKDAGKSVVGYGAAAKGNTLLTTSGVGPDLIDYVVDANPNKQGLYLPGSHIPIHAPGRIRETKPDYIVILPWNLKHEIVETASFARGWGARFVVAVPELAVLP